MPWSGDDDQLVIPVSPTDGQPIEWNFSKFLVGPDGKVVKRFGSRVAPGSEELVAAVEQTLAN